MLEKGQQQEEEDRVEEEKQERVLLQEEDRSKMVQMFNEKGKIIGQHTVKYSPTAVFSPSLHARPHIFLWYTHMQKATSMKLWYSLWGHLEYQSPWSHVKILKLVLNASQHEEELFNRILKKKEDECIKLS